MTVLPLAGAILQAVQSSPSLIPYVGTGGVLAIVGAAVSYGVTKGKSDSASDAIIDLKGEMVRRFDAVDVDLREVKKEVGDLRDGYARLDERSRLERH